MYIQELIQASHGFAAKTDRENEELYLPVWMHALDTAGVMDYLVEKWLSENTVRHLTQSMAGHRETLAGLCRLLALINDIGMHTALFQSSIRDNIPGYELCPLRREQIAFRSGYPLSHARAGEAILLKYGFPPSIAAIVGAHHGVPQSSGAESEFDASPRNFFGNLSAPEWEKYWEEFIGVALRMCGFRSVAELPNISMPNQMLLTGLLIMSDWIASDTHYFPLISIEDRGDADNYPLRVDSVCERLGLDSTWDYRDTGKYLAQQAPATNGVHQMLISAVKENTHPGIFIVEAPAKYKVADAAVTAAEILAKKVGCRGLFYGLPIDTVSHEAFAEAKARIAYPSESDDDSLFAQNWFANVKKEMLASFSVKSIEPLLMMSLQSKHVMLHHLGLSGKVVIIDEVQLCNAHMQLFLNRSLTWLGEYEVPVIIMSSSLPLKRRTEMIGAYLQGLSHSKKKIVLPDDEWKSNLSYPLITWTDGMHIQQTWLDELLPSKDIPIERVSRDSYISNIQSCAMAGRCIGVILNSIDDAQDTAKKLTEECPDRNVILYHERFLAEDLYRQEVKVLDAAGKKSTSPFRDKAIIVGTQSLFSNLDVDFDQLFMDTCPMDLLLRGLSHIHRYERSRSGLMAFPRCVVIELPKKNANYVYGEWPTHRILEILPDSISFPNDIPQLMQEAFTPPDVDMLPMDDKMIWDKYVTDYLSPSNAFLLTAPKYSRFFSTINGIIGAMPGNTEMSLRWSVISKNTSFVDAILLKKDEDGKIAAFHNPNKQFNPAFELSKSECEIISKQRIRLSGWLCRSDFTEEIIAKSAFLSEWQRRGPLKRDVFLVLNEDGGIKIQNIPFESSPQFGFYVKKKEA